MRGAAVVWNALKSDRHPDPIVRALAKEHLWEPGTDLRAWLFTILGLRAMMRIDEATETRPRSWSERVPLRRAA